MKSRLVLALLLIGLEKKLARVLEPITEYRNAKPKQFLITFDANRKIMYAFCLQCVTQEDSFRISERPSSSIALWDGDCLQWLLFCALFWTSQEFFTLDMVCKKELLIFTLFLAKNGRRKCIKVGNKSCVLFLTQDMSKIRILF